MHDLSATRIRAAGPLLLLLVGAASLAAQEPQTEGQLRHHTGHHRFEDAEHWSKQFDDPERDAWQKPAEVISLLAISPGMTAADIGAGTGYFVAHLTEAVGDDGRVLGLDVEPTMVEFIQDRAEKQGWSNVEARVVEPDDPGLPAGTIDRILIVNTWHHIEGRDAYARKLHDALTPQGSIYIVDLTLESENGPPVEHRLAPERVIAELDAGGLDAELLEESLPEQYIVVGRRP